MARIMRSSNADGRLVDANREHAAQIFLSQHPDVERGLPSRREGDLYASIVTHISLIADPGRRQLLTTQLRQEFEKALIQPNVIANVRSSSAGRYISNARPDPEVLLAELYEDTQRDASSRPLGNVAGHAHERLAASYAALKLVEVARDQGLLPKNPTLVTTKAMVQDKRTSQEYPAAHRMPGDLAIQFDDGTSTRLTNVFRVGLSKVVIDKEIFGRTDRVNRLANVADSWAENSGMKDALAKAATEVARGSSPQSAMKEIIEPGYAEAVNRAYSRLSMNLSIAEQKMVGSAILDGRSMQPFRGIVDKLKLSSREVEARAHAKELIRLTLQSYSKEIVLSEDKMHRVDNLIEGIKENEQKLGMAPGSAPNQNKSIVEQAYYRQQAMQVYQNLMGQIEKLAIQAVAASVKAEKTYNDPHATDGEIRASFAAVETYTQLIGSSLVALDATMADDLSDQLHDDGITVLRSDVEGLCRHVINNVEMNPKLHQFYIDSKKIASLDREYANGRRNIENMPDLQQTKNDEVYVESDYNPRP